MTWSCLLGKKWLSCADKGAGVPRNGVGQTVLKWGAGGGSPAFLSQLTRTVLLHFPYLQGRLYPLSMGMNPGSTYAVLSNSPGQEVDQRLHLILPSSRQNTKH